MSHTISMRSLASFLPPRDNDRARSSVLVKGMQLLREAPEELPIQTPKDSWETFQMGGESHIRRTMQLGPREMKMLICDLIDAQDTLGHTFTMRLEGDKLTVTSTTKEYGEPTERDREVARYVDTSYDEIRTAYK